MYTQVLQIEETVKGCAGCNTKHLGYSSEQMRNKQIDRLQTKPLKPISVMLNITTKYALTLLNPKKKNFHKEGYFKNTQEEAQRRSCETLSL